MRFSTGRSWRSALELEGEGKQLEPWLIPVLAAIISAGGGIGVTLLTHRVGRRYGLPTDLESRLITEMRELNETLEANNTHLELEVSQLNADFANCKERLAEAERKVDDLTIQVHRLATRLRPKS